MDYFYLSTLEIFNDIDESEIKGLLSCLMAYKKSYKKGDVIYRIGDHITDVGLVIEGNVNVVDYDYLGNKTIIANVKAGDIFGLAYAAIRGQMLLSDIIANKDCEVLYLNIDKILTTCSTACYHHNRVVQNLFQVSAIKNLQMQERMKHISAKTIREKVISYLSDQALEAGDNTFDIVFNRQQLSEYLGVDRSALSSELSRMKDDGLIDYNRNHFVLKDIGDRV